MTFEYAVTFELGSQPPETVRGTVESGSWHTASARAIRAARKALPKKSAQSIVVLLSKAESADKE